MARNTRDPFAHHKIFKSKAATGPFSFLNPTRVRLFHELPAPPPPSSSHSSRIPSNPTGPSDTAHSSKDEKEQALNNNNGGEENDATSSHDPSPATDSDPVSKPPKEPSRQQHADQVALMWRSRDNRKGRHALVYHASNAPGAPYVVPERTNTWRSIARGLLAMATQFPYWDVSWLVAVIFTLGSMVWVINAFFVWLPLVQPATLFPGEETTAGGWSAFVGATIFEVGSVLLMIEAVNANRTGCFGWELAHVVTGSAADGSRRIEARPSACAHHHANRRNFVGKGTTKGEAHVQASMHGTEQDKTKTEATGSKGGSGSGSESDHSSPDAHLDNKADSASRSTWQWYPSWHDLITHYIYDLGFLACFFQMFGATVFWISGFTAIPQIQALLATQVALNEGYWVPQVVGGSGFIVSSSLFMLETQPRWYIPAPRVLGWHIGLWNLIGAFGFTLCGALGLAWANPGAQFEASLATFWGSWAFLIGSAVQWYESLDKHPVEESVQRMPTSEGQADEEQGMVA